MRRRSYIYGLVLSLGLGSGDVMAAADSAHEPDVIEVWNQLALTTVREKRASDAEVARLFAMVNVAMYDAVNGIQSRGGRDDRDFALVSPAGAPGRADLDAAAAAAAQAVLLNAYPDQRPRYTTQFDLDAGQRCGGRGTSSSEAQGRSWGTQVGAQVVQRRYNDGSSPVEIQAMPAGSGQFSSVWSGVQFRNLKPFAIANSADYVTAGPPAMDSLDYAAAFAEVKLLGAAGIPDPEKQAIFQYWSLSTGTAQPPGEWIKIALDVTRTRSLELAEKARLFALLAMALADTVGPTVTTKFTYAHWRPTTAIRQAQQDPNYYTEGDTAWTARGGGMGTSPEHTSGHSAFSAAAATVLAGFFCNDAIAFSHISDSAPGGQPRGYPSFSAAAVEAGRSRVFGGLHFEFSNQAGLTAGRGVASEVLAKKLLRRHGKTHLGQCPL